MSLTVYVYIEVEMFCRRGKEEQREKERKKERKEKRETKTIKYSSEY